MVDPLGAAEKAPEDGAEGSDTEGILKIDSVGLRKAVVEGVEDGMDRPLEE